MGRHIMHNEIVRIWGLTCTRGTAPLNKSVNDDGGGGNSGNSGDNGSDDDNGGDSGGRDAATAAGTDTDNNQLKATAEGRWRQRWW